MPHIKPFGEKSQSADEHHDGTRGVDGTDNGDGQVLQSEVSEEPAGKHDARLEQDVLVFSPSVGVGEEEAVLCYHPLTRQNDEGQKYQRRKQRVEQQHRNDGVAPERFLLEDVVETEQCGGKECE